MVHFCFNLAKKVPCYVCGHGTLLLEVGQKSTMLKVAAKVQQIFDSCKQTPIFFIWWNRLGIKKPLGYISLAERAGNNCPANGRKVLLHPVRALLRHSDAIL